MKIRNATNSDLDSIIKLFKQCNVFYHLIDKKGILINKLKHDQESIIIAEDGEKLIGVVCIVFDPWQSFIYHLAVEKSHRNMGIGNKLMEKAESVIKKRGCKLANIFIEEENEGVMDFYKKRNWYFLYKCMNMEKKL